MSQPTGWIISSQLKAPFLWPSSAAVTLPTSIPSIAATTTTATAYNTPSPCFLFEWVPLKDTSPSWRNINVADTTRLINQPSIAGWKSRRIFFCFLFCYFLNKYCSGIDFLIFSFLVVVLLLFVLFLVAVNNCLCSFLCSLQVVIFMYRRYL